MPITRDGRHGIAARTAKKSSQETVGTRQKLRSTTAPATQYVARPSSDLATRTHHVTFFNDAYAKHLTFKKMTLPALCSLILRTKRRTKDKAPWLKMALFGNKRTEPDPITGKGGNCLRHDENVLGFEGIELDYDKEEISFDDAVRMFRELNIRCLIYTSPSHTKKKPRWRVLIPVSGKLPLEMRGRLCARINGKFNNIFDSASFTLSQAYYYGSMRDNPAPDHRAVVLDGCMIDTSNSLHEFEKIGWPKKTTFEGDAKTKREIEKAIAAIRSVDLRKWKKRNEYQRMLDDMLFEEADEGLASMQYGGKYGNSVHQTQRDVSYRLVAHGVPDEIIIERLMAATFALPEAVRWSRAEERRLIIKLCDGARRRLAREQIELGEIPAPDDQRRVISLDEHRAMQRDRIARAMGRK
jgi:hypothetical protein